MAPLADFILSYVPLPSIPYYLTSYVNGKTPLSTPQEVFPALVAYLVIIFGTRWFMQDKPAYKLQIPFQIHNVFLSAGSLLLMSLILEEVIPMVWKNGVFWGMCSTNMWTNVCCRRVIPRFMTCTNAYVPAAFGILLYHQLLLQVPRAY
jgi:fatty acid elongase 3